MSERTRIVIIGDSISAGYTPLVQQRMRDDPVTVVRTGGGDSAQVLANLEEWAISLNPLIIHFNCGLHDLRLRPGDKTHQQEIGDYEANLCAIVRELNEKTTATLLWATITPVIEERHNRIKDFHRFQRDVLEYNSRALSVMRTAGIRVNDLHGRILSAGPPDCLGEDGVHMTHKGNRILADAFVAELRAVLSKGQ